MKNKDEASMEVERLWKCLKQIDRKYFVEKRKLNEERNKIMKSIWEK